MKKAAMICFLLAGNCLFSCSQNTTEPIADNVPILINEFMASNQTDTILDESGQSADWIELYNNSDESYSLKGLFLSDDSTDLKKYALPDSILPAQSHFLVWADNDIEEGSNHAGFKLSASRGEEIILSVNGIAIADRIIFYDIAPAKKTNASYGRREDGSTEWEKKETPTPGWANIVQ